MSKTMINAIEITLIAMISILTFIFNPPLPLLAIPFMLIITIRTICMILDGTEVKRWRNKKKQEKKRIITFGFM